MWDRAREGMERRSGPQAKVHRQGTGWLSWNFHILSGTPSRLRVLSSNPTKIIMNICQGRSIEHILFNHLLV